MKYDLEKQHEKGKLHAIERLVLLFDDKFTVLSPETDEDYDGVITAQGEIRGITCCAFAQDFSYLGGSMGARQAAQIASLIEHSIRRRYPLVCINDSVGARLQDGIGALDGYGDIFRLHTYASGVIPQISLVLGPCAGGAAYAPALTDFIFMADDISRMFITGEKVIKQVTREEVDINTFGKAEMHAQKSGVCHGHFPTERDCLNYVRDLISVIKNQNNRRKIPKPTVADLRRELLDIVPADSFRPYNMLDVIQSIADQNQPFFEVQEGFAKNIIIGFSIIGGCTVGFVASQPSMLAGSLDCDSSDKAARFIRFCDCFDIPIVSLTDTPGYFPGVAEEDKGIIRHGAKILYAFSEARVPKINFVLRQAFGGAYIAMNSPRLGADAHFVWKLAKIGIMGNKAAEELLKNKSKSQQYLDESIEDNNIFAYICPEETRICLINALRCAPRKKKLCHGNIPL